MRVSTSILFVIILFSSVGAQTVNDPKLRVREVVAGLSEPTMLAFIGPHDILVLQKGDGRVRRVINGVLQPGEVLDVAVHSASERGLLGIAVHPDFPATPFVYLYYTESSTGTDTSGSSVPLGNRVYRYTWNGSVLTNPTLILDLPVMDGPNHNGGIIMFGPDEKLYVIIGDLNLNGQLQNYPAGPIPDDTSVILRLNDNGTIPSDNPFFAEGGNLAKYYAYGIRNSFGMAFDPLTNKLWDTENGPNNYDEINLVEPGLNSGWEQIMGPDIRDPQGVGDLFQVPGSHYADPKFSWLSTVGPTAMVFVNSARLGAQYHNDAFVGDINNGNLYHFKPNANRDGFIFVNPDLADLVADSPAELGELVFGTGFGGITDLKLGPDGVLYIVSYIQGKIFAVSREHVVDFDGDGKTDIAVYEPSTGNWFWLASTVGFDQHLSFGGANFLPLPGDNDGDGATDTAVYDSTNGDWFIDQTTVGFAIHPSFGGAGYVPVPGDYDGDGKTDIAVYQVSSGAWCYVGSTSGIVCQAAFGGPGYIPVPGDYDNDGTTDLAVYDSATGNWFINQSTAGFQSHPSFGGAGYVPVPGDYDGDGKTDIAVYLTSTGNWFYLGSTSGFGSHVGFGGSGYMPAPGDYDGDGLTDTAVYDTTTGNWFIDQTTLGFAIHPSFGGKGYVPVLPQVTILMALGFL